MTNLDRAVWHRIFPAPLRTYSLVSELVSSVHPTALLPLHRHVNAIHQALSHLWPTLHALTCPCIAPALAPHALMHCIVSIGRHAYFPRPMRPTIPNLRPHLTVSPEPICVPLSSRCASQAIRLHVAPAASTAHATTSPRVPRVRSCTTPKPRGHPTPVRGTYRSLSEQHRPPSWLPQIRPHRVSCAPPHLVPHPRQCQTCPVHPLIFQVAHDILPHTQHSVHLETVASFICCISNASTMMTINGWLFCSLPTAPPPPKLASCSCASHAPACRVSRPSRSLSMLCGAFISNGNGWPLWPLMVVSVVTVSA
jgi:hypothetical protein